MGLDNWVLVSKLRKAVKKVTFLLNFNLNKLKLAASLIGRRRVASPPSYRRLSLSLNDRASPGLMAAIDDYGSSVNSSPAFQRTMSCPSSEDDIDKRAETFIANFYRQLQIERQVSLELRYRRRDSFGSP